MNTRRNNHKEREHHSMQIETRRPKDISKKRKYSEFKESHKQYQTDIEGRRSSRALKLNDGELKRGKEADLVRTRAGKLIGSGGYQTDY
jgi:hypothetical protein